MKRPIEYKDEVSIGNKETQITQKKEKKAQLSKNRRKMLNQTGNKRNANQNHNGKLFFTVHIGKSPMKN